MNFGSGFQVDMGWRPQGDQPPPLTLGAIGTAPRGNSDRGKWTALRCGNSPTWSLLLQGWLDLLLQSARKSFPQTLESWKPVASARQTRSFSSSLERSTPK